MGQKDFCEIRGDVTISGIRDAPILWPIGKRGRGRALVVYKDVLKALHRGSNLVVSHWWGVDPQTVSKWCRLSGDPRAPEETSRLNSEWDNEPWAVVARAKAHNTNSDPECSRKIAEARRGKPRPPHVIEAIRQVYLGTKHSVEARRRRTLIDKPL
jgi:hypothetical protein